MQPHHPGAPEPPKDRSGLVVMLAVGIPLLLVLLACGGMFALWLASILGLGILGSL